MRRNSGKPMQKILEVAEKERIYITYKDLQHEVGSIQGFYTIDPRAGPLIVLDRSLPDQPKLHRCVAAHELGHHFHPPRSRAIAFHRSDLFFDSQKKITISQDENKALRWATELLMPTAEVWAAVRDGYSTVHQLAECFAVTEGLAWAKIGYLRKGIKKLNREEFIMIKRIVLLFLCVAAVLLISGCAGEQEILSETNGSDEVESKAEEATLRVGETAKVGNTSFTLNGVRQELGDESWAPEEGDMWIVFDCTVENNDSESAFVTTIGPASTFVLYDEDGYSKNTIVIASPKGNLNAEIAPGRKISGEVAFVVDEDETEWEFVFAPHGAEGQAVYTIKKSDIK